MTSQYLQKWCVILKWSTGNKFQWNSNQKILHWKNIRIFRRQDGGHFVQASVYVFKRRNYHLFNVHFINSTILRLVVIITVVSEPWSPDYVILSYWNTICYGCVIIIQLRICVYLWHKRRLNLKSRISNHDRQHDVFILNPPASLIRVVNLPKPFI